MRTFCRLRKLSCESRLTEAMGLIIHACRAVLISALLSFAAVLFVPGAALHAQEASTNNESDLLTEIVACLKNDQEAVLSPADVDCKPYRQGSKSLTTPPYSFDITECGKTENSENARAERKVFDKRQLSANVIHRLMTDFKKNIGAHGIRILGAIFCEEVTIIGHKLPFSLVLDESVFASGIEIRNIKIRGDVSVDGSLVFKHLKILRSQIEGSVFGDNSFITDLLITNSAIHGSVSFNASVLYGTTLFDSVSIKTELSVRASALSVFMTQFSKIGGLLDLSHSEARCAYHINKSTVGYLLAKRVGFGTIGLLQGEPIVVIWNTSHGPQKEIPIRVYNWRKTFIDSLHERSFRQKLGSNKEVSKIISKSETCLNEYGLAYRTEFFVFDSTIASSLCINEFRWLTFDQPSLGDYAGLSKDEDYDKYLKGVIAIDGNTVGNNLIIDLQTRSDAVKSWPLPRLRHLEIIGLKAGALIIDFKDISPNQKIAVDGLGMERIYSAHATCEYGGSEERPRPLNLESRKKEIVVDFREQLQLPTVSDVLQWLELNKIESTQPYAAFAAGFRKAGVDSTDINIARENL